MTFNVLQYLEASASLYPEKLALADGETYVTYQNYRDRAQAIGSWLAETTNQIPVTPPPARGRVYR